MSHANPNPSPVTLPWWRERMLWLVLGGPIVVVIASFVTLALALTHPDPVLSHSSNGQAADDAGGGASVDASRLPAQQARNHAATGGK